MEQEFKNRVIVVTGGARGIGACLVDTFVRHGAVVAFSDVESKVGKLREKFINTKAGLSKKHYSVVFIRSDMGKERDIRSFADKVLSRFKRVDVLINNVGIGSAFKFLERPLSEWDRVLAVNLRAAYLCSQLFAGALAISQGCIINIASSRSIQSESDTEPYTASKGGIRALTHSLAVTLGKVKVRVNCISPGWIDTSKWQMPPVKTTITREDHAQHPACRVGQPEDIAEACLFLASNRRAGFITGQNLVIDGGMTVKMIYLD